MDHFDIEGLLAEMRGRDEGQAWREFLRVPSLSMGVYRLKAGEFDRQTPHSEDEVYYVIAGRATFSAGGRHVEAGAGTILFVEKNVEHRFTDVREALTLLVFFAPAEHTSARPRRSRHESALFL